MSDAREIIGQFNGGATCWLNATYQALCAMRPFMIEIHEAAASASAESLVLAAATTAQLARKFFGTSTVDIPECARGEFISAAFARADQESRVSFARIVTVARSLGDPRTFYECASLARVRPLPIAICAMTGYGAPDDAGLREHFLAGAALRLFCGLVIYCATTGARPTPEYGTIGEVGPAMLETIIGALEYEGARNIRALFNASSHGYCLCAEHIIRPGSFMPLAHAGEKLTPELCIHVVPPSMADAADARDVFVAQVQASVDVCERNCKICAKPGVAWVEMREDFAPIIAIATDDMIARGLTRGATSTATYRRSPMGTLCVPQIITVMRRTDASPGDFALATYQLRAQIIQEGGHFVARIDHWSGSCAYVSDTMVSMDDTRAMPLSPGVCTLFYARRVLPGSGARDIVVARARAESIVNTAIACAMYGYAELNSNHATMTSSGYAPQQLAAPASIVSLCAPTSAPSVAARFYATAVRTCAKLRAPCAISDDVIAQLLERGVGIQFAPAIARAMAMIGADAFAFWKLWTDSAVLAMLNTDECDKLRVAIAGMMGEGIASTRALLAHPAYTIARAEVRDVIARAIERISGAPCQHAIGTHADACVRTVAPRAVAASACAGASANVAIFPRRVPVHL